MPVRYSEFIKFWWYINDRDGVSYTLGQADKMYNELITSE